MENNLYRINDRKIIEAFQQSFEKSDYIHLNNAGYSLSSIPAKQAIVQYTDLITNQGAHATPGLLNQYEQGRQVLADFVGSDPFDLAIMPTTSSAISQIAMGLDWHDHDEILLWKEEYPSNIYPWLAAAKKFNLEVKWIKPRKNHQLDSQWFIDAISAKTRIVAVSWVQYLTGAMVDLKAISQACKKVGAWLVVDGIQGIGIIPFDLKEMGVDALCGGSFKWLCGIHGHGYLALAPGRCEELNPILHGSFTYGELNDPIKEELIPKKGARKFEPGSVNVVGTMATAASVKLLKNTQVLHLNHYALQLAQRLKNGLLEKGANILGNLETQSPIVTFIPHEDGGAFSQKLTKNKISHAFRYGNIRISPHGFNTEGEIDQVLSLIG